VGWIKRSNSGLAVHLGGFLKSLRFQSSGTACLQRATAISPDMRLRKRMRRHISNSSRVGRPLPKINFDSARTAGYPGELHWWERYFGQIQGTSSQPPPPPPPLPPAFPSMIGVAYRPGCHSADVVALVHSLLGGNSSSNDTGLIGSIFRTPERRQLDYVAFILAPAFRGPPKGGQSYFGINQFLIIERFPRFCRKKTMFVDNRRLDTSSRIWGSLL